VQSCLGFRVEGLRCRRKSTLCITNISPGSPKHDSCNSKSFSNLDHRLFQLASGIWHQRICKCDACCQELGWIAEQRIGLIHQRFRLFLFPSKSGCVLYLGSHYDRQKALTCLFLSFQQQVCMIICRDAGSVSTHLLLICCFLHQRLASCLC
jgi:hypothetical protein